MKKVFSVLLTVFLLGLLTVPAFAVSLSDGSDALHAAFLDGTTSKGHD